MAAFCRVSLAGICTEHLPDALQWRDVVLASFSQWHGTRHGANAMLVNATEDVQVWRRTHMSICMSDSLNAQ